MFLLKQIGGHRRVRALYLLGFHILTPLPHEHQPVGNCESHSGVF